MVPWPCRCAIVRPRVLTIETIEVNGTAFAREVNLFDGKKLACDLIESHVYLGAKGKGKGAKGRRGG
jgi:hypothetical protein